MILAAMPSSAQDLIKQGKEHFKNMRQLTFGDENAEAYFSGDNKQIILQSTRDDYVCDQIYTMDADGSSFRMVSNGPGRTACPFFNPRGGNIIYASTYLADTLCTPARIVKRDGEPCHEELPGICPQSESDRSG